MNEFSILETEILIPILKLLKNVIYSPLALILLLILLGSYIFKNWKEIYEYSCTNYNTSSPIDLFKHFLKNKLISEIIISIVAIVISLILLEIFVFNKYNI